MQAVRGQAWGAYRATDAKLRRMEEGEKSGSGKPLRSSFRRPPYADPETADISEAERRRAYLASAEYQQRRQELVEWEQRQRAQAAYEALRRQLPSYAPRAQEKKPWWRKAGDAIHGAISSLPSIVDGGNAIGEIINVSKASSTLSI